MSSWQEAVLLGIADGAAREKVLETDVGNIVEALPCKRF